MAVRLGIEKLLEFISIDEVAVVRKDDAIGRVDVERLRFGVVRGAGSGIADYRE